MELDLSKAKAGDVFITQDGIYMQYCEESYGLHRFENISNTNDSLNYWFDKNGINRYYSEIVLLGQVESELPEHIEENIKSKVRLTGSGDVFAKCLKVIAWLELVGGVIATLALIANEPEIAWIPILSGVLSFIPTMVLANTSIRTKNIEKIQKEILSELKKQNK